MENIKQMGGRLGLGLFGVVAMTGLGVLLAGPSSAADPAVTGAFTTLEADLKIYIAAVVALVVVAIVAMLGIKYLRKGVSKA